MLHKSLRLRKKEEIETVFRQGKPLFFDDFACRYRFSGLTGTRFAFSFGKKHLPLAAERNRLRRRFSEAIGRVGKGALPEGADIVFFLAKKPKETKYATIERTVIQMLSTIRLNIK